MSKPKPLYHRHRFPPEIIAHAVWLYHRFSLSFRDIEELLAERGITVSYETIRQWLSFLKTPSDAGSRPVRAIEATAKGKIEGQ